MYQTCILEVSLFKFSLNDLDLLFRHERFCLKPILSKIYVLHVPNLDIECIFDHTFINWPWFSFHAWVIMLLKANIEQSISATCTRLAYWIYLRLNIFNLTLTYFLHFSDFDFKSQFWAKYICNMYRTCILDESFINLPM